MPLLRTLLLIFLTACTFAPVVPLVPTPAPTADALGEYRRALNAASQNDLALADRATRYDLTLTYTADPPTLAGNQRVVYTNRQSAPLGEIYFRLFANYPDYGARIVVRNVVVNGAAVVPILEARETALRVPLAQPLAPNDSLDVRLDFVLTIPRVTNSRYADFGASDAVTLLPSFYPLIPAYDGRGWHIEIPPPYGDLIYADAAFYAVTLTAPSALMLIVSGTTIDARVNGDGTTTTKIVGAPMRDFDLNITTRLQKSSETLDGIVVNSYYEPAHAEMGKQALRFALDALRVFQARFGAYPYAEFDLVEAPITALGIEYPGVIVLAQSMYENTRQLQTLEFVVAHEIAHQWWYNLVGNDQVNHPWVDEALAQYSEVIYTEELRGAATAQQVVRRYFGDVYKRVVAEKRDAVVNQPVAAFTERSYGEIVYGKGPLFFDAIRKTMGDEKFFAFLKTYATRYRYRVAFPEDVLNTAEQVCACSLRVEYQQWILESK